jgi:hypothetical protein
MKPKALKVKRTLTPLETAEPLLLLLEEPLGAGELEVELGVEEIGVETEDDKVTP